MTSTPRICLVGHSGAGKSTTARIICDIASLRHRRCEILKVGTPLYELQQQFYTRLDQQLPAGQQDQQLLETFARLIRARSPEFLLRDFLARADASPAQVLVCDDVRSYDYDLPELRRRGWITARVTAPEQVRGKRLAAQGYISLSDASTVGVEALDVDYEIVNDTNLHVLHDQAEQLLAQVLTC